MYAGPVRLLTPPPLRDHLVPLQVCSRTPLKGNPLAYVLSRSRARRLHRLHFLGAQGDFGQTGQAGPAVDGFA